MCACMHVYCDGGLSGETRDLFCDSACCCVLMCPFPLTPCRAVVFVVDSAAFQREVKDVAEFLYQVLIDSMALKNTPSFLVACNKQGASWQRQRTVRGLLLGISSFTCSYF